MTALLAWLASNPLFAAILALVGIGWGLVLKNRYLEGKVDWTERMKERADTTARLEKVAGKAERKVESARQALNGGQTPVTIDPDEAERRKKIAEKYKVVLLAILIPAGTGAYAATAAPSPLPVGSAVSACAPDADFTGLLKALEAEGPAGKDGAAVIRSYQTERETACRQKASLRAGLEDALAGADLWRKDADMARDAYMALLKRPMRQGSLFGFTAGVGVCSTSGSPTQANFCGALVWGIRF